VTYDQKITFHLNGEDVEAIPIRAAHTDGDTLVRFVKNDILMTGDYFRSLGYPNIDRANGGTLQGMLDDGEKLLGQVRALQARIAFKPLNAIVHFPLEEVERQILFGFEIIEQRAFGDPRFS
jgi:glyoxylase-like metal-dependent hydrolase (beta-lactamase superfamily II)